MSSARNKTTFGFVIAAVEKAAPKNNTETIAN
jgi:hypothetical protein